MKKGSSPDEPFSLITNNLYLFAGRSRQKFLTLLLLIQIPCQNHSYTIFFYFFCFPELYSAIIDSLRDHADSAYALRSNSPPAQRILTYPYAKIRLRESICYPANAKAIYYWKRRMELPAKKINILHVPRTTRCISEGTHPIGGRGVPKTRAKLIFDRKKIKNLFISIKSSNFAAVFENSDR